MIAGHDFAIFDFLRIDIPQKDACAIVPLHPELLIEIAIVNLTAPSDADGVAAHQTINRCGVKRLNQQLHVFIPFIVALQATREPPARQTGEGTKLDKNKSKMLVKFAMVIVLELEHR